ncbi:MAG: hypothetical protein ACI837_001503 [Crocinitomicaceae bacterium]|jgi:hypothetical protein
MKIAQSIALLFTLGLLFYQCDDASDTPADSSTNANSKDSLNNVETPKAQSKHDKIAKFLAGIELDNLENSTEFDTTKWGEHSKNLNVNWEKMEKTRLNPMSSWVENKIVPNINDTLPLFYPFSGPDFLHANYLFPKASGYTMMALEGIGELPDFSTMSQEEMDEYLKNINLFLRDIYRRSYFITKNMEGDVGSSTIRGILPVLYVFVARSGYTILDVERIGLSSSGEIVSENQSYSKSLDGVRFYLEADGITKELIYWDCDLSNSGFEKTPEMKAYLSNLTKSNTFLKSASYLLHYSTFGEIRELVLEKSLAILEDDTGVPYEYFKPATWRCRLYGGYEPPIKDFSPRLVQPDLKLAYEDSSKYSGKMPFSLGYHWGSGVQNYMLYAKIK